MDIELGAQLIDSLQVGLILLDHEGRVVSWNGWMKRHSGLGLADVAGRRLAELFPEVSGSRLESSISDTLRFKLSSMLAPNLNPNLLPLYHRAADRQRDQRMYQLIYVTPLRHDHCACLIQIHDMTSALRRERRLRAQLTRLIESSYQDPLTGVGNRRRFDQDLAQRFRQAKDRQRSIALLMIDVDNFKAYNDHFGHQGGDACLIQVARTLRDGLRRDGDRVSRYGGEEFAILLADTDGPSACAIAERLRLTIEQLNLPHPAAPGIGRVSISVGIAAMVPSDEQFCHILVAQADLALYSAKDAGRNCCMWYDPATSGARALSKCNSDRGQGADKPFTSEPLRGALADTLA